MDTIIQQIVEKVIKNINENFEEMINQEEGISGFILNVAETLNEVGVAVTKEAIEKFDDIIKNESNRKEKWIVKSKNDKKSIATMFGQVDYERTYYENKKTGRYAYLSDEILGIKAHDKMDVSLKSKLVEEAIESPYRKSADKISKNVDITGQTVMNTIRELGSVKNNVIKIKEKKKEIKTLYIEADEDHVANQHGSCIQPRLVYVHEGREKIGKTRNKLKNIRMFSGVYKESEDLWLEVANYIDEAYDMEKIEKIYLSGDGALWIKQGIEWINKSIYVLDRFHLSKYVKKATAHIPYCTSCLWNYINRLEKENVEALLKIIIKETKEETKKKAVKDAKRYILNNWEGIVNQYEEEYIGCSAEGHISHVLSDRLSSRPLGWSEKGVDQIARLRVFKENGGKVYEEFTKRRKKQIEEEKSYKVKIMKSKKKMINKKATEIIRNVPIITDGRTTGIGKLLRQVKGA